MRKSRLPPEPIPRSRVSWVFLAITADQTPRGGAILESLGTAAPSAASEATAALVTPAEDVVEEATTAHSGENSKGDENEELDAIQGVQVKMQSNHPLPLEPEVLERLCGAPIELRGYLVLTAPRRQVAFGDPGRRTMAD